MNDEPSLLESPPQGWLLRTADQGAVAGLLVLALLAIAGSWIYRGGLQERTIDVKVAEPQEITFQIDINQAVWPEWTALPGIGETLAKRIADSRDKDGPFRDHEDLKRVRGIGPRTLERLRPYLVPMPKNESVAGP